MPALGACRADCEAKGGHNLFMARILFGLAAALAVVSACSKPTAKTVSVPESKDLPYASLTVDVPAGWTPAKGYSMNGFSITTDRKPGIRLNLARFKIAPEDVVAQIERGLTQGEEVSGTGMKGYIDFPEYVDKLAIGTGFLNGERGLVAIEIEAYEALTASDHDAIVGMALSVRP